MLLFFCASIVGRSEHGRDQESLDCASTGDGLRKRMDSCGAPRSFGSLGQAGRVWDGSFQEPGHGRRPNRRKWKCHPGGTVPISSTRLQLGNSEGGGSQSAPALESAQRELREECGLSAKRWIEILGMDLSNSVSDERSTAFLAWELSEAPAQPDETEKLQVAVVPFWEAVERAKRGEIRDAISVAALVRVALMALQGELPEQIARAIGGPKGY